MDVHGICGSSMRGKQTFILNRYEYCRHRENAQGHVVWRCHKARAMKCIGNVVSNGLKVVRQSSAHHNHEGNISRALA